MGGIDREMQIVFLKIAKILWGKIYICMNNIFGHVVVLYFIAILYNWIFLGYSNIFKTEEAAGGQNTPIFKCRIHFKNSRDLLH